MLNREVALGIVALCIVSIEVILCFGHLIRFVHIILLFTTVLGSALSGHSKHLLLLFRQHS